MSVGSFICDAPARAFLKCTKGHNAYYACERCTIKGRWNGRVVFSLNDERNTQLFGSKMRTILTIIRLSC